MLSSPTVFNENSTNQEGLSNFHLACLLSDATVVEEFLKRGVDVNSPCDFFSDQYAGYSPLHFAVKNKPNHREIVNVLLKHGANIYAENTRTLSPLINLCGFDIKFLEELFERYV